MDIFDAAGLKKPDISILSDEFLAEVQHLPQRNLAVELLQKLLNNELKIRSKKYLVQSRSFAEMLEATIRKYQNRTIEAAQVIAELIPNPRHRPPHSPQIRLSPGQAGKGNSNGFGASQVALCGVGRLERQVRRPRYLFQFSRWSDDLVQSRDGQFHFLRFGSSDFP